MTSYFKVNKGQSEQLDRLFDQAGMTLEDAEDILAKPELLGLMVATLPRHRVSVSSRALPAWYISPEHQLERVKQLNVQRKWGFVDADFPSVPANFVPRTDTEVLLFVGNLPQFKKLSSFRRTFNELWDLIVPPRGYSKICVVDQMRRVPGYQCRPGFYWVAFDPNAYHKLSPKAALEQSKVEGLKLAGLEVLWAALLFPDWAASWNGRSSPYPNLSGLQSKWQKLWSGVPYFRRWDDGRRLKLHADGADYAGDGWSSPSVREC
jgi:hypothetical protein